MRTHIVAGVQDEPECYPWYRQQHGTVPMNHILVPVVQVAGRRGLAGAGATCVCGRWPPQGHIRLKVQQMSVYACGRGGGRAPAIVLRREPDRPCVRVVWVLLQAPDVLFDYWCGAQSRSHLFFQDSAVGSCLGFVFIAECRGTDEGEEPGCAS